MKRGSKRVWMTALIGAGIVIGSYAVTKADGIVSNQPGSVDDPLITKSYVDQQVQKLVQAELTKQSITEDKVKQWVNDALKASGGTSSSGTSAITVVELKPGQKLYAGSGGEFIVRTGATRAFSNTSNGIPDVTGGKDLAEGTVIPLNHLLIFPSEGRGIQVDTAEKGKTYVMVRGKYLITNADGSSVTSP